MNIFILGLRVLSESSTDDDKLEVLLTESLPSNDRKIPTKVQLKQDSEHYVGKLMKGCKENDQILAVGPTRPTPDGHLLMQPMLIVTNQNWSDILAINAFIATGGLGPKSDEVELGDSTVTNRSIAWQTNEGESETCWFKLTAWGELSKQLSDLQPGTPCIAVGKVSTSEKDDKKYLNYNLDKVLYLPRNKVAPKKAADPDAKKVAANAIGSLDFKF